MYLRAKLTFRRISEITACALLFVLFQLAAGCAKKPQPQPPPPKVTVVRPERKEITEYLESTGTTQAVNTVQLVARVSGYLDKVFFHDGQMVKKGQPLFLIQQDTYQAGLQQAEGQVMALKAQLEYAQAQLERYTALLPRKAAAQTDVDNWRYQRDSAVANLKTAEANRDLAKLNLDYTRVSAPFNGRIDRRLQDPGNLVGSGANNTALAQLTQIDPIYVYFTVSDKDLARLMESAHGLPTAPGANKRPVFIALVSERGYPHEGRLDFAATTLTATTGTLLLRGVFANPSGKVLPGLYVRVRVPVVRRVALLLPETTVASDQVGSYVMIVNRDNIVERRGLKTGHAVDNMRTIEEGLQGNERVIAAGLLKVHPGVKVSPEWLKSPSGTDVPAAPVQRGAKP
jgi:RND family efflux transporter MFP subunit